MIEYHSIASGRIEREIVPFALIENGLREHEYRLWLNDNLAIYGVRNVVMASGYRSPDQQRLEAEPD